MAGILLQEADHAVAAGLAEHQQVGQRVGAQPVGAVHRCAGAFAGGVEARHHRFRIAALRAPPLRRGSWWECRPSGSAGRHHRNRILDRIDVGELLRDLADARQALLDHVDAEVIELEQDVVAVLARAAPFLDLGGHGARDHVAAREVLHGRRVALHEALAVLVQQVAALAAHAFGDQHAGAGHARSGGTARTPCPPAECRRAPPCPGRRRC